MNDCIFCKIGAGEIPAKLLYQDDDLIAFRDIAPQAPTHILICPRKHVVSLDDAVQEDAAWLGRALLLASKLAKDEGLSAGHRTVINNGEGAGQSVSHLHVHVLGGRDFRWPPG